MDVKHVYCGANGWAHLPAVVDGHNRQIVGDEFARRGRAREAEQAVKQALPDRFGTLQYDLRIRIMKSSYMVT